MTKNFLTSCSKIVLVALAGAAFTAASAGRAFAVNTDDAARAYFDETANAGIAVGGANVTPAVNLQFTGKTQAGGVAASSGAYVTISATAMSFFQPAGTADASVGTAGVVTYATTLAANTMGALCDYLNALGASYKCALQGAKRDDPPKILQTQTATDGTNNLAAVGGFSVLQTTTTFVSLGITPAKDRRVVLKQCVSLGAMAAGDKGLQVYGQLRKYGAAAGTNAHDPYGVVADDTYNVWASTQVTQTATTIPSSNALPRWLEFAQNAHVVVREGNVGSISVQAASNYVQCAWDER